MKYYLIVTDHEEAFDPGGDMIDNFQILDFARTKSLQHALKRFCFNFKKNTMHEHAFRVLSIIRITF